MARSPPPYSIKNAPRFARRSFAPAVPFPSSLTANTMVIAKFVRGDMYDGVKFSDDPEFHHKGDKDASEICLPAYNFNVLFLVVQVSDESREMVTDGYFHY